MSIGRNARPSQAMLLAVAWLGPVTGARAQVVPPAGPLLTDRYTAVRDRNHPETDPIGVSIGAFDLSPSFGMAATYDDNVLSTEVDKRADLAIRLSPQLSVQSNWGGGDKLGVRVAAQVDRYAKLKTENGVDLDAATDGAVVVSRSTTIRFAARWQNQRESRQSQDIFVQTQRPVRYSTAALGVAVSHKLARVLVSGEASLQRVNYKDAFAANGLPIDEDFRDSDLVRLRGRVSYSRSPAFGLFTQLTYDRRTYSHQTPGATQRDSEAFELLGGVAFEPAALLRGEIGVGYLTRRYNDPAFGNFSGLALNGKLELFVTQLTTVTVTAKRDAKDSGTPGSSGYISTGGQVSIDHELLRSLILTASVSYEANKYNGIDRNDRRWSARAIADYKMNRNFALRLSYDYQTLGSRGVDRYRAYKDNRVLIGVTAKL